MTKSSVALAVAALWGMTYYEVGTIGVVLLAHIWALVTLMVFLLGRLEANGN